MRRGRGLLFTGSLIVAWSVVCVIMYLLIDVIDDNPCERYRRDCRSAANTPECMVLCSECCKEVCRGLEPDGANNCSAKRCTGKNNGQPRRGDCYADATPPE